MGRLIADDRLKRGGLSGLEVFEIRDVDGRKYETDLLSMLNDVAPSAVILTDGLGTTANGTAVDLGGTAASAITLNLTGGADMTIDMTDGSVVFVGGNLGAGQPNCGINAELYAAAAQSDLNAYFSSTRSVGLTCYADASDASIEISSTDVAGAASATMTGVGFSYDIDLLSRNTSNDRWLVDKGYSDSYFTGALTDGAPTSAEVVAILGTAASRGAGYKAVIKDTAGTSLVYTITCDGTSYYYIAGTIAA